MIIKKTKFDGLLEIKFDIYSDIRGDFIKIFNKSNSKLFKNVCYESYINTSKKGVVRGLHGQLGRYSQDKLIYCIKGKLIDLAVDLRKNSKTFGKVYQKKISAKDAMAILIPKGFAHGIVTLENDTIIVNYCSTPYNQKKEFGINLESLNIKFKNLKLIISEKDKILPTYKEYIKNKKIK